MPGVTIVGVVSDTHLPRFGRRLPDALRDGLDAAGVELILHAGDLTGQLALDLLAEIAPVVAVAGNNDPPELLARLGDRRILEVEEVRIGLAHGHLGPGRTTPERARRLFEADDVDLIVFGHSHQPLWTPAAGSRPALLNPGSPTDRRREPSASYALLSIDRRELGARIVRLP